MARRRLRVGEEARRRVGGNCVRIKGKKLNVYLLFVPVPQHWLVWHSLQLWILISNRMEKNKGWKIYGMIIKNKILAVSVNVQFYSLLKFSDWFLIRTFFLTLCIVYCAGFSILRWHASCRPFDLPFGWHPREKWPEITFDTASQSREHSTRAHQNRHFQLKNLENSSQSSLSLVCAGLHAWYVLRYLCESRDNTVDRWYFP